MSNTAMLPKELQGRVDEIARKAYENGIWSYNAAMSFRRSVIAPENIESWERTMNRAIRAKKNGGIKDINLSLF